MNRSGASAPPLPVSRSPSPLRRRGELLVATLLATTALTAPLPITPAMAQSLPTGGNVAAGGVAIAQPSATQLNIVQSSQSAIVNWQSFSIGAGSAVNIAQPNASSAILNRVTGNTPSSIAGSLTANGQVYLVNPNGIAITSSGTVDTRGGFVASTLGITDGDFMAGRRRFSGNGSSADVSNAGTIRVGRGGYAALIGGTVSNSGSIDVPLGKVGLGSGEQATLDFSGDGFLQVAVPTKAGGVDALIRNSGRIRADGGSVTISAATAREAARNAVNISGLVQARSISGHNGAIIIGGGAGGRVAVSGRVSTASRHGTGGRITVTGKEIALTGARVDASGRTGGGTINIGGDYQGQGPMQRADSVSIDAATTIRADATRAGHGGNVVVWSDQLTSFAGTISARGGAMGGDGGNAEVSGKAVLDYRGFTDLSATKGAFGTLLLDPYSVIISTGGNNTGGSFTGNTNDSIINVTTLENALAAANVVVSTGGAGSAGTQFGDITVAAPITWSAATTLDLEAAHSIAINAPITIAGGGGLTLTTNLGGGTGGTLNIAAPVQYTGAPDTGSLTVNGTGYTLIFSMAEFAAIDANLSAAYALARNLDASGTTYAHAVAASSGEFNGTLEGLGNTISNLTIDTSNLAINIGLFGSLGTFGVVRDIGLLGGAVSGGGGAGELAGQNRGTISNAYATGAVSGGLLFNGGLVGRNSGTISNAYATGAASGSGTIFAGGLVGYNQGTILNAYATGAVSGGDGSEVGGLVGAGEVGSTISNAYATGAVSGGTGSLVGGLVGGSSSTINNVYAAGAVSGGTGSQLGGLVGDNAGSISNAYATGSGTGPVDDLGGATVVGGLVGNSTGSISNAYATGAVSNNGFSVGGLVGTSSGTISDAYATGAVSGNVNGNTSTGGLAGRNDGTINNAYATGAVHGSGGGPNGGLAGYNSGSISNAYATGAVNGGKFIGGLVGYNDLGTISYVYATGAVSGSGGASIGGLVGENSGTISNGYWDTETSGLNTSAGGAPLTTAGLQGALPAGFDPAVWGTGPGLYPYLKSAFPNGVQAISGIAYKDGGGTLLAAPGVVSALVDGTSVGSVTTGANGYYYVLVPAGTISGSSVLVYTTAAGNAPGAQDGATLVTGASGTQTGLNVLGSWLVEQADASVTSLSALNQAFATAAAGTPAANFALANRTIGVAAANFVIDRSVSLLAGTLVLQAGGVVTQTRSIGAQILFLQGGSFTLTDAANQIGALAADAGSVTLSDAANLIVAGVTTSGAVTLASAGDLTIASGARVSGANPVLSAGGKFINNEGSDAVTATTGRWLIYSNNPADDTFGGLDSANTAVWNTAAGAAVGDAGNRYVFALQPTVTFTTTSATKTYGDDATAAVAGSYTVSAGVAAVDVAGAYRGISLADAFQGTPSVTSAGAAAAAGVTGSPYAITASAGNVTSPKGYALAFVNSGTLTVNPASLTITANNAGKTYDGLAFSGNGVTYSGFVNGETASVLGGTLAYGGSGAVNAGSYVISAGGYTSSNYTFSYAPGTLTVTPAALTVTVNNAEKTYSGQAFSGGNGVTYSGLVNGETASVLGGTLTYGGSAQGAVNVGSYGITAGGYTSSNYTLSYAPGSLTVTPAALIVTANNADKFYDGKAYSGGNGVSYTGLVNGETAAVLGGTLVYGGSAQGAVNVGSYVITPDRYTSDNYAISYASGTLTVQLASASDLASGVVRDGHSWLAPPSQPGPVLDGQPKLDARGTGLFYADPRSEGICFGGSICFSTRVQDAAP